jgi:threonine/homoserine/homoserine lactone efflux protein
LEISFFIKGFVIGMMVAAPLGPIGILSLQRTVSEGYLPGLFSGLGISTADAIYGSIAAFGVTAISGFLISQQLWFRLIGGAVICGFGFQVYSQAGSSKISSSTNATNCFGAYFSALILTLMNPALIISFAAIFAGLGIAYTKLNAYSALLLVVGVFSGSAIWWLILSCLARRLKMIFTESFVRRINHVSGVLIVGFGLFLVASAIFIK